MQNGINFNNNGGFFSLHNIPTEYNSMYAYLNTELDPKNPNIMGAQNLTKNANGEYVSVRQINNDFIEGYHFDIILPRILNGAVSLPMFINNFNDGEFYNFNGNITVDLEIRISSSVASIDDIIAIAYFNSVKFQNGSTTMDFKNGNLERFG